MERLPTYSDGVGNQLLGHMTRAQALRHGDSNMPRDLKRAGFETYVFRSDLVIHGGDYFRITFGKAV